MVRSEEESIGDQGDGINAYLGMQFFDWGAVESMGATAIRPTH